MGIRYNFIYTCDKCGKEFKNGILLMNNMNNLIKDNSKELISFYKNGCTEVPYETCYCNDCFIEMLKGENN
jgi:hypothetical protein